MIKKYYIWVWRLKRAFGTVVGAISWSYYNTDLITFGKKILFLSYDYVNIIQLWLYFDVNFVGCVKQTKITSKNLENNIKHFCSLYWEFFAWKNNVLRVSIATIVLEEFQLIIISKNLGKRKLNTCYYGTPPLNHGKDSDSTHGGWALIWWVS